MRIYRDINVPKSLQHRRLYFEEHWWEKLDTYFFYFIIIMWATLLLLFFLLEKKTPNDAFINYVIPFPFLFLIYAVYRKIFERDLLMITTKFDTKTSRQILLDFAKSKPYKNYNISKKSNDIMIMNEYLDTARQTTSVILLIRENEIFFTMLKSGAKLVLPVFFSHYFLKKELQRYFDQKAVEILSKNK